MSYAIIASFFLMSVGYSTGWTAVSSMLGAFKVLFGPASFLWLNLAYFLPSIPVLLLQARYDHKLNERYGLGTATSVRMILGLGVSAVISALLPFFMWNERALSLSVVLLGISSAIAFSSSYQLAPHFPDSANIALTAGFVGGGPLILLLELVGRIGPRPTFWQAAVVFEFSAVLAVMGLVAAQMLLHAHWRHLEESSRSRERKPWVPSPIRQLMQSGGKEETPPASPLLTAIPKEDSRASPVSSAYISPESSMHPESEDAFFEPEELLARPDPGNKASSMLATWQATWPAVVSLFLSVGASMVVSPFFTYVPSSGRLGDMLPQALFAARTLSDIFGRLIPFTPCILTKPGLLAAGIIRAAVTPGFFWYIRAAPSHGMLHDGTAVAVIAVFWAASGHVNACAYVMAAAWAPLSAKERAGGLMALVFQLSCLLSLLCATAVQQFSFGGF